MSTAAVNPAEGLTFDDVTHTYRYNGVEVVSVTQAIKAAGLINDTWYTPMSRDRGRAVHLATQFEDEGCLDEDSLDPVVEPYLIGYRKFKVDTGFKPELIEARLCVLEYGYAGTLDRTGLLDKKQRAIVDFKTGELPFWVGMQLAGYANGLPNGATYTRYAVQLKNDGTYKIQRFDAKDYRQDLNDLLAAVRIAQIQRENGIGVA
jgi:hypothetical protein